jgi:polysaccharide export outer membrane protein
VGDLKAAGHRPEALAGQIETLSAEYLTEPNVTVIVRQILSRKAFITGEVNAPGVYPLSGPLTVMQLIALAGGLTEFADEQKIGIMRTDEAGQTTAIRFNYKWIREGRNLEQNILLKPGDTVVVP